MFKGEGCVGVNYRGRGKSGVSSLNRWGGERSGLNHRPWRRNSGDQGQTDSHRVGDTESWDEIWTVPRNRIEDPTEGSSGAPPTDRPKEFPRRDVRVNEVSGSSHGVSRPPQDEHIPVLNDMVGRKGRKCQCRWHLDDDFTRYWILSFYEYENLGNIYK